jgi:hypothetical protein
LRFIPGQNIFFPKAARKRPAERPKQNKGSFTNPTKFDIMNSTFAKRLSLQSAVVLFFSIVCLSPLLYFAEPSYTLDGSWAISINLAIKNRLTWGDNYVFSYGPLGFLATGLKQYVPAAAILLFRMMLFTQLVVICQKLFSFFSVNTGWSMIITIALLLMIHNFLIMDFSMYMLLSTLFWICESLGSTRYFSAAMPMLMASIMLFVKLDTGIVINFLFCLLLIYQITWAKIRRYLILLPCYFALIFGFASLTRINLVKYVGSAWHVVNAYNDAMYVINKPWIAAIAGFSFICILLILVRNRKAINSGNQSKNLLIVCLILISTYVFFKHAFVRGEGLGFVFPPLILVFTLYFYYFINLPNRSFLWLLFKVLLPVSLFTCLFKAVEDIDNSSPMLFSGKVKMLNFISVRFLHKPYNPPETKANGVENSRLPYILPSRILSEIKSASVDVVPHMVSMIYFNNLNYNPRPSVQTYAAYDKYLDSIDAGKYQSPEAPSYIIYCGEYRLFDASIDNRYPFFDEPKTKIAIMQNYEPVDSFGNQLLLKKRRFKDRINLDYRRDSSFETTLNSKIAVPFTDDLLFANFSVEYSFWGKTRRLMYQPPPLSVEFTLQDSSLHIFKMVETLTGTKVLLNKYIVSNAQFSDLLRGDYEKIPRIVAFRLMGASTGYTSKVGIHYQIFAKNPLWRMDRAGSGLAAFPETNK